MQKAAAVLAQQLVQTESPDVIQALAEAVTRIGSEPVRRGVVETLGRVTHQGCIDQVCAVWNRSRQAELGALLEQAGWVASGPDRLALLTALKSGRLETVTAGGPELVKPLLQATRDEDPTVARQARQALARLGRPEAQAEFYRLVIEEGDGLAVGLAAGLPYAPPDPQRRALFYLLTAQWERYEELDFDRSLLRAAYQVSDEWLQGRIVDLIRQAGRPEFVEVIAGGRQRRRLAEMSEVEWAAVLALLAAHQSWPEMWRLAQAAPAVWSVALLAELETAGWSPALPDEQAGLAELQRLARDCAPEGLRLGRNTRCQAVLTGHSGGVYDLAISPDRQLLASSSDDRTVRLWSLPGGELQQTLAGHTDEVWGLAMSPDGRLLISGSDDDTVRLWRLPDGAPLQVLAGTTEAVNGLAISPVLPPGGRTGEWLLASGSRDHSVRLWQLPHGKGLGRLNGHSDLVIDLAVSPDGQVLASGSRDGTIRLWRLPDGAPLQTLKGHTGAVNCLAFSGNGHFLASGGLDGMVRLWLLPEGTLLKSLPGHTEGVVAVVFSPANGELAASAGLDRTVRLWRVPDGAALGVFKEHTDWAMSLAVSRDGELLASGGMDGAIRLWGSDLARLSRTPAARLGLADLDWVQETLKQARLTEAERGWLKFLQALLRWQRRFDVEVEEAPQHISIGEFDIEIEG